jgi:hypothetical protein
MASQLILTLRSIQQQPTIIPSNVYKQRHCWPDGGCVTGVSDRATRRNRKFGRKQFKHLGKQNDQFV